MDRASRRIIKACGNSPLSLSLVVENTGGFLPSPLGNVPSVRFKAKTCTGGEVGDYVQCRGYYHSGKWRAKQVATEVWSYYQARGVEAKVTDKL